MKILLDTHIFLWFISGDNRLSADVRDAIRDSDNEVYLSVVSIWESIVKYQLGKLPLPLSPEIYLPKQRERHQIANLDLDEGSVTQLTKLPLLHRDPFDRMLICQALQHNLTIATVDPEIIKYSINVI
ncbi:MULTISPECIES: type II toxin-antitoxin system VapC family toxin [Fischerella]|uniref:PIN domain-containing protein n=1 Tax=Fischerella muscicola CCMEE 5323 TaxID=2019572 RepID=A0A2N6K2T9_FISMU|nr:MULTISPECIES: type II toxin-antitoxin system VapC family toxin [Fischerella]MBD2434299.1 type II toxin-antitoxin system VapC family toxin [Fischerella sp. FACHB-380]PLZ89614.1 PIN domain-containing protein [Fischerella muscicola CCMEE 5323]